MPNDSLTVEHSHAEKRPASDKYRVGIDLGMVLAVIGFSFNAGVTYDQLNHVSAQSNTNTLAIQQVRRDAEPLDERVAAMEAILADIRDNLRQQNERQKP